LTDVFSVAARTNLIFSLRLLLFIKIILENLFFELVDTLDDFDSCLSDFNSWLFLNFFRFLENLNFLNVITSLELFFSNFNVLLIHCFKYALLISFVGLLLQLKLILSALVYKVDEDELVKFILFF
jgi:hypothetical protein